MCKVNGAAHTFRRICAYESGAAREINHDARVSVEYREQRNKVRVDWDSEEF